MKGPAKAKDGSVCGRQALWPRDPRYHFDWVPLRKSGFKMLRAKRIDVLISNDRVLENFYQNEKIHPGGSPEIVPLDRGLKKPWNPPRAVAPHSEG